MIADSRRLALAAFRFRPFDAFDRIVGDGVFLAEIFEQRGERQAMMCARVTVRNSSGRAMPVKRKKSATACS
jgi:hypothetical protein